MITDEEVDDFLEHYGVKGMRWGVRKQRKAEARAAMSPKQRQVQDEAKKLKRRAAVGITVGVGAGVAIMVLNKKGKLPTPKAKKENNEEALKTINSFLKNQGNQKVSSTPKGPIPKPKSSSASSKFIKDFTAKQNELLSLANADLKAGYERNQVPLPKREYLDKWEL